MQNPPPPPPPPEGYTPSPPTGLPPPPPGGYPIAPPPGYPAYPAQGYGPQVRYAGFWIRVVAYIIDAIILGIVEAIIDLLLRVNLGDPTSASYRAANGIGLILSLAYFAGLWTYLGGSLGQRVFGLRVVDVNTGQPLTLGKAVIRWLGLVLSFLVCFIGVIWVAFDSRKQGWMDKIAGTLVVHG
ncbi:MAG: RDD family protein [Candidatus Dormibacteraeota bacterium]|nr:RDD family protein [Candidatus Dormibacteraeota bacterium]